MRKRKIRFNAGDWVWERWQNKAGVVECVSDVGDLLTIRFPGEQFVKICHAADCLVHESKSLEMTKDPLIKAAEKAYRSSKMREWDKLRADQSRWSRKLTIAANKLDEVRRKMDAFTQRVVCEVEGVNPDTGKAGVTEPAKEVSNA